MERDPQAAIYFRSADELRDWFAEHHATASELIVGYYKKGSGEPSLTWAESVDQALCFGWIDGVRRGVDGQRYTVRFTPRRARSTWSAVNIRRVEELSARGLMHPAGLAAFAARDERNSAIYSHEQPEQTLHDDDIAILQEEPDAWAFFSSQPPSYRKAVIWWVNTAKRPETRLRRLQTLRDTSARGERLSQFTRNPPGPF